MTLEDFEYLIKQKFRSWKIYNYSLCIGVICFGLYLVVSFSGSARTVGLKILPITFALFLVLPALYGIWILRNNHKVQTWNNTFTKTQNIELLQWLLNALGKPKALPASPQQHIAFIYQTSWWRFSYSVHLFAGPNCIAIHADATMKGSKGFIDFGASKRLQNKIIRMLEERAVIYQN